MRKAKLFQAAAAALLLAGALTGCARQDGIDGFQGMPWGVGLTDVIQTGGDFALVRSEEDVTVLYRLDGEGRLAAGEYALAGEKPLHQEEQVAGVLDSIGRQLGEPDAMNTDASGAAAGSWQAALAGGSPVSFTWNGPDGEVTCQMDAGGQPLMIRVILTPPAEPGEEDGFDGFPYGTPAEEIAAEADWRYWHLAQEGVSVGGLEATAVYRFDGDGELRAGWYDFPGTDQAAVDAAWQAGLTWLEETYGLASGEDGDPTSLWTVGKVQVSLARTPDGVRLTVAGDGYPV